MALTVGSRLGHYDVTALIGEGGMGQVYQARDTNRKLGASVVIGYLFFLARLWAWAPTAGQELEGPKVLVDVRHDNIGYSSAFARAMQRRLSERGFSVQAVDNSLGPAAGIWFAARGLHARPVPRKRARWVPST